MEQLIQPFGNVGKWVLPAIIFAADVLTQGFRVLREYERGVVLRLGKLHRQGAKGPGLMLLIPGVDRMVRMDLRLVTIDVAKQEITTRDNVPDTVDAVVYFRVIDPLAAFIKVENFWKTTSLIAQMTLRIGRRTLLARSGMNQTNQEKG